jgi:hypothetical protein
VQDVGLDDFGHVGGNRFHPFSGSLPILPDEVARHHDDNSQGQCSSEQGSEVSWHGCSVATAGR